MKVYCIVLLLVLLKITKNVHSEDLNVSTDKQLKPAEAQNVYPLRNLILHENNNYNNKEFFNTNENASHRVKRQYYNDYDYPYYRHHYYPIPIFGLGGFGFGRGFGRGYGYGRGYGGKGYGGRGIGGRGIGGRGIGGRGGGRGGGGGGHGRG